MYSPNRRVNCQSNEGWRRLNKGKLRLLPNDLLMLKFFNIYPELLTGPHSAKLASCTSQQIRCRWPKYPRWDGQRNGTDKNNKIVGHWLPNHRWGLDRRQNYYLWTGPVRDPNLERRTSTSANGNFWEPSRPRPIGAKDCSPDCSTRFAKLFKSPLAILPKLFPCALLIGSVKISGSQETIVVTMQWTSCPRQNFWT